MTYYFRENDMDFYYFDNSYVDKYYATWLRKSCNIDLRVIKYAKGLYA